MSVTLVSWGGAGEVTGSKHALSVGGGARVLVDCGAFQGRRSDADKKNRALDFAAAPIDAVVLSHAHYDHCGLLPLLTRNGYQGPIYSTAGTRDLASLILQDSARIQERDADYLRRHPSRRPRTRVVEPLYSVDDATACLEQFVGFAYHRRQRVADGVDATFYDAGHILGSALPVIDVERAGEPLRICLGGDLGRRLPILRDPEVVPPVDYLVLESTYGNRRHPQLGPTQDRLAAIVTRTVERGGKIIIPAFAIGRTQELVFALHLLRDAGRIPAVPMFVDSPMATSATTVFTMHPEYFDKQVREAFLVHSKNPFGFEELSYTKDVAASKRLNDLRGPAIIISASGMCEAGRILHHLANNVENPRNTILVVGFMAQHTLGRRIVERKSPLRIFDRNYRLRADVEVLNAFSAHADSDELLGYVRALDRDRLRKVFLVHGEPDAQAALATRLTDEGVTTTIVRRGERYVLD